jgi:hypothetical protein
MQRYEYRVMPAPRKAEKVKGAKTTEERFAAALTGVMNELGAQGWEYLRADTLPCEERSGLTGSKTTFQTLLVFRRAIPEAVPVAAPSPLREEVAEPASVTVAAPAAAVPAPVRRPTPLWLGKADAPTGQAPVLGPATPRPADAE